MASRNPYPDQRLHGYPSQGHDQYHDRRNNDRTRGDIRDRQYNDRDREFSYDRRRPSYSDDHSRNNYDPRDRGRNRRYHDRDAERSFDHRRSRSYSRSRSRSRSRSYNRSRSPQRYRSRTPPRRMDQEREWQQTYTASARNASLATAQAEAPKADDTPKDPTTIKDTTTPAKPKKRKAETQKEKEKDKDESGNARLQAQFGLWQNASAQVHGAKGEARPQEGPSVTNKKIRLSFADLFKMRCLLCRRQFTDQEKLRKHERKSKLHRANIMDREKRHAGYNTMVKHGVIAPNRRINDANTYIDRAKERRQLHSQPSRPQHQAQRSGKNTGLPTEDKEDPAAKSRGASMMSKMGWAQGQGLGADGTGRDSVIETSLYAQGIGLGASGGKLGDALEEADRSTKGNYNSKGWDKTRERFEALKR